MRPVAPVDYVTECAAIRRDIVDTLIAAGRGHLGPALSLVEILGVLYLSVLRFDPKDPRWADRDRLILSKGHGCLALYAWMARLGYFPREELWRLCRADGILGGHPDHRKIPGVETSTGSLGHGLSFGIGAALALRRAVNPPRVYVILGDGECGEGSVWEAALSAAHHHLGNLTVLVDANGMQSYGAVEDVTRLEPQEAKWRAFGFDTREVDLRPGPQTASALETVLAAPREPHGPPLVVICRTTKGAGVPMAENSVSWHHKAKLSTEEIAMLNNAVRKGPSS